MKRDITYLRVGELTALGRLFWNPCSKCYKEIKGEPMWAVRVNKRHPSVVDKPDLKYFCKDCAPTRQSAADLYDGES